MTPLEIDFLYLDLSHCGRCKETGKALGKAVEVVTPVLEVLGFAPTVHSVHVTSVGQGWKEAFIASPTVRVNGVDIQSEARMSICAECGNLCACEGGVECREWIWRGRGYFSLPVGMMVEAILAAALGQARNDGQDVEGPNPEAGVERFLGAVANAQRTCCL